MSNRDTSSNASFGTALVPFQAPPKKLTTKNPFFIRPTRPDDAQAIMELIKKAQNNTTDAEGEEESDVDYTEEVRFCVFNLNYELVATYATSEDAFENFTNGGEHATDVSLHWFQ